jgi:PAS domain S-box-containing protein
VSQGDAPRGGRSEDDDLRAVTLENARTIFLARRRAEEELLRAKEELARQSELLRVTLSSIGDAVVTTDNEGRVLSLNRVAEELTGFTDQEAHGQPLADVFRIVNEHSRKPVANPAEAALRDGRVVGLANHTVLIARDGTEVPIDDAAAPIRDEQGKVHGVVLVFRSVAERRRKEAELRDSEQELSDFFENASVGMHWVGPDGTVLRANRAELELLGYERDEYVGRNIAEFHADRELIADLLRRLAAGQTLRDVEARMRCKDGSIKEVLIDSSVFWKDGRFVHTRSFTRDISDRKRAELTQARLAAIVESSDDAIVSKTLDSRITSWNAGAQKLFGYTAEEAIGQSVTMLIPPERHDEERQILERLGRGERIEHYETVRVTRSGRRIVVSLTISPIRDVAGRIVGASKIARDVTARKLHERRLLLQSQVTQVLSEAPSLREASPRLLRAICEALDWDAGGVWYVDEGRAEIRCTETFHVASAHLARFDAAAREMTFARGRGLLGRVWANAVPVWISEIALDDDFARAGIAAEAGLHSALGFPIVLGQHVRGVMELFSRERREPDPDVLEVMRSVGGQIGQFVERRRAEAALRESEHRFRLMANGVPSMIWTAAPDGTITYANERWLEFCGSTPEQNASGWPDLVPHPDDLQRRTSGWRAALRDGTPYEIEVRHRRHDGVYRWLVTRAVPVRDERGAIVQWFGTTTDIDDRKRAEMQNLFLAEASAELAQLNDEASALQKVAAMAVPQFADWCAVDLKDESGSVRRLSVAHVDPAKLQLVREIEAKYPPRPSHNSGVAKVIRTGELEWAKSIPNEMLVELAEDEEHLRVIRKLGLKSYICVPLKSRGVVLGAISFATAESGRTYSEGDVRAAGDLANRAVIALENARLIASLREADRRKDEFLAMLAHELRNPLAPIRNAVQIFRAKAPPVPELRWAGEVVERQVRQMTRLVDDLLDVSRITRGRVELRRERIDLATVVNEAIEASRPLIKKWGHQLSVSLPPEPVLLDADPARLAQVIGNLLNNAAKYTDQGGRIELLAGTKGEWVSIRVRDNGIGIPKEKLRNIFELFTQIDPLVERSQGGLGIGLTLVQRLTEMHGGRVEAFSDGPGRGSEFVIELPLAVAPAQASPSRADTPVEQPSRLRILVVDDNRDAADSLAMLLEMLGNDVHTAHDGLEAVGAAAAFHPDVVLLDIGLPKLNGYEVAQRIREMPGGAKVLLVALTGWGQEEDRRRTKEAGFDQHMTKPVELANLQKLLAETERTRD